MGHCDLAMLVRLLPVPKRPHRKHLQPPATRWRDCIAGSSRMATATGCAKQRLRARSRHIAVECMAQPRLPQAKVQRIWRGKGPAQSGGGPHATLSSWRYSSSGLTE